MHRPRSNCVAGLLSVTLAAGALAQSFEVSRHTIDGGGVIQSTGGAYELSGTIGQPDAGAQTGGAYELSGGFWFPIPPGDADDDGLVSLSDYDRFAACLTGPGGGPPVDPQCAPLDLDANGVVDLSDAAAFFSGYTGQ